MKKKEDIRQNGIKVELHITKTNTILCGHQRWEIAKEIELKTVPCKIINIDESDKDKVKEYVIKDNLLRRQLTTEQKYNLIAMLSEVYEVGSGGDRKSEDFKSAEVAHLIDDKRRNDVLTKPKKSLVELPKLPEYRNFHSVPYKEPYGIISHLDNFNHFNKIKEDSPKSKTDNFRLSD